MNLITRYLAREIIQSTIFVFTALLMLFAFFDLIHELADINKGEYSLRKILQFVLLSSPGHVYELFPIAVLISTVLSFARLASHSELTVMRISGLSTTKIGVALLQIGCVFGALAFIFGEYISPLTERTAQQVRLTATRSVIANEFHSGLWAKDQSRFVNVRYMMPDSSLVGIKIYQFNQTHQLQSIQYAETARFDPKTRHWQLEKIMKTYFDPYYAKVSVSYTPKMIWESQITPELLTVFMIVPEQMSARSLWSYVEHLRANHQHTTRYEIALWGKIAYPVACVVMLLTALLFVSHSPRSGGTALKVFIAIMVGLGFHLFNRLFSHLGLINDWSAPLSAFLPSLCFLLVTLLIIYWRERKY